MQGDDDAVLSFYFAAVDSLETDRCNLRDEQSRGTFVEDKIEGYYNPILHLLERRRFAEAFELLERSRSRAAACLLASKRLRLSGAVDRDLFGKSLKLKGDVALVQKEVFALRSLSDREMYEEEIAAAEEKIERLEGDCREVMSRIARESPKLQELLVSQPVFLREIQHSMKKDGYEVLYYLVLESSVILWHISGNQVHVRSVFLPRSELINKVTGLRKSLTD